MGRRLTAVLAASALMFAACGDDGDDEGGDNTGDTQETVDNGSAGDAAPDAAGGDGAGDEEAAPATGGDSQAFCDALMSGDAEALAQAEVPAEIAEAWDASMGDVVSNPESVDPSSAEMMEVGTWVATNCAPGDGAPVPTP